ncbi:hypothetical protein F5Y11DRAFT_326723 [Daldinia sp. FL1419]|nr:hypothetical protein F5Y11DRAFT_326723 [Daldinia sp. FL1419]
MSSIEDRAPEIRDADGPSRCDADVANSSNVPEVDASLGESDIIPTMETADEDEVLGDRDSDDESKSPTKSSPRVDIKTEEQSNPEELWMIEPRPSAETVSIIYFDIDSDLDIPLWSDSGPILCKVSSAHLALASPVWRAMLYGNRTIKKLDTGAWVVPIDGDPFALMTLFRVVHYEFDRVPGKMSVEELYCIATVLDRYKCAHLVYPWAETWVQRLPTYDESTLELSRCSHKTIFIAWVLGDAALFRDSVEQTVITSELVNGQLVDITGKPFSDLENIHKDLLRKWTFTIHPSIAY